jgi:hypothetical protein
MVIRFRLPLAFAATALLSVVTLSAGEFQLGKKADQDVTAPVAMDVINPAATEALKEKESQRVPAVLSQRAKRSSGCLPLHVRANAQ